MRFPKLHWAALWPTAFAAVAVLIVGLLVTFLVAFLFAGEARRRDLARFDQLVSDTKLRLETHVEKYEAGLASLQETFSNRQVVRETDWNFKISRLSPSVSYSSLFEAGFALFVGGQWRREPPEWLMQKAEIRGERPSTGLPPTQAWTPILFQYRADGWPAIEYGTELYPRDWADDVPQRAYKTDELRVSHKKTLTDPAGSSISAITMYLPIYDIGLSEIWGNQNPGTFTMRAAVRESAFRGLVFASVDMNALVESVFGRHPKEVEFELFSSDKPKRQEWLNDRTQSMRFSSTGIPAYLHRVETMRWYGENWSLYFYTTPLFIANSWKHKPWLAILAGVPISLLLAGITWVQARGRHRAEALAASLHKSELHLQTLLRERERMSRDLHDGTIQSLYAVGLGLGRLRKAIGSVPEKGNLDAALAELDRVVAELRGYLVVLDPGVSPAQHAPDALNELISRLRQTAPAEISFSHEGLGAEPWPPAAVLDLLQGAREGISNALRHGHATKVEIRFETQPDGALLVISDNGIGFQPGGPPFGKGHGLVNLQHRVRNWDGSLNIDSRPGGPTSLTLKFAPFPKHAPQQRLS